MAHHLDTFFTALADPTRRAVIERLALGPASVSELHAPHDMALPSFLKHLKKLEAAGLIRTVKRGRRRIASLQPAPLAVAEGWLAARREVWEREADRLAVLAEDLASADAAPKDPRP